MGCYTIYVVREPDGSVWWDGERGGLSVRASAEEVLRHLETLEGRAPRADFVLDRSWCQGWYVDRGRRIARSYPCSGDLAAHDQALRSSERWPGWDVGVAWEKTYEVAALAGVAAAEDPLRAELDGWGGCDEARLLTRRGDPLLLHRWDPASRVLRHEYYYHSGVELSVIDGRGRVRDHGFERSDALFHALGHGPGLLDELAAETPCPGAVSEEAGATIDVRQRAIHFWLRDPVAPATLDEVRRRWPGWTIERDRAGLEGLLRRTGREDPDRPSPALEYIVAIEASDQDLAPAPPPAAEAALLRAIHDEPEVDERRQVYADLLLARGDRRGELINVQCELARLARTGVWSERRRGLERQEQRLLRGFGDARPPGGGTARFRRGFVAAIWPRDLREVLASGVLETTIDELHLDGRVEGLDLPALLAAPGFSRLRHLALSADMVGAIAAAPQARGLRRLGVRIDEPAAIGALCDALAGAHHLGGLDALELSGEHLDAAMVEALLGAMRLPGLRDLTVWPSRHDRRLVTTLASCRPLGRLTSLTISWCDADAPLTLITSRRLPALTALATGGSLGDDAARPLAACAALGRLTSLTLHRSDLSADGLRTLARSPHLGAIRHLVLGSLLGRPAQYADAVAELLARIGPGLYVPAR